jgi:hypothetical protein
MAEGISAPSECGPIKQMHLDPEVTVCPAPARLAWMLRHTHELIPRDGRKWDELRKRVADRKAVTDALALLDTGTVQGVPDQLVLEGRTHADCLIECANALIWIEGKRFDWLDPSITWDVTRDQLARNIDAVASLAAAAGKDYRLLICHEHGFKHHETLLLTGYRTGAWAGGLPHVSAARRQDFAVRIGTLTWATIARHWPGMATLPELQDLRI